MNYVPGTGCVGCVHSGTAETSTDDYKQALLTEVIGPHNCKIRLQAHRSLSDERRAVAAYTVEVARVRSTQVKG